CVEDDGLVDRLVNENIPLTVCPVSNVRLNVFKEMEHHNLKQLLDRGVCVTVNSDDPSYFGAYLTDTLIATQSGLKLDRADILQIVRNSVNASFVAPERKRELLDELAAYDGSYGAIN
ncbi:MAG: adenosine deaminase, partial [Gemmatimonadales bacterium]